jgi:DNA-binding IclR family transcriptional regulator
MESRKEVLPPPLTDGSDDTPARGGVKSAIRTLEILELLSGPTRRMSVATMARTLNIPKSSLHGILRTMEAHKWLETDETGTQYGLGIRALLTGNAYVESDRLVNLAQPVLDSLADQTGEAVHLGRLDDADIVYLAKRESANALRLFSAVGRRLPAHATALGKSVLAGLDDVELQRRLPPALTRLTNSTITDLDALRADLELTRQRGYAYEDGENTPGICCVAVALTPTSGSMNALSCSIPAARVTAARVDDISRAVLRSAQLLDALVAQLSASDRN